MCCADRLHCCAPGQECDNEYQTCKDKSTETETPYVQLQQRDTDHMCPDKSFCSENTTCCEMSDKWYACCPIKNVSTVQSKMWVLVLHVHLPLWLQLISMLNECIGISRVLPIKAELYVLLIALLHRLCAALTDYTVVRLVRNATMSIKRVKINPLRQKHLMYSCNREILIQHVRMENLLAQVIQHVARWRAEIMLVVPWKTLVYVSLVTPLILKTDTEGIDVYLGNYPDSIRIVETSYMTSYRLFLETLIIMVDSDKTWVGPARGVGQI